jgi:hypothetical protein
MAANCAIKQYFRYYSTCFILYHSNVLVVNNGEAAVTIENVASFSIKSNPDCITLFLVAKCEELQSTLKIKAIVINKGKKEANCVT